MTSSGRAPMPVTGQVDARGTLTRADSPLEALNRRAGGKIGAPLAVPALARFARLASRLDIDIARRIIVGDIGGEVELCVRAIPDAGDVLLEISGWEAAPERPGDPLGISTAESAAVLSGDWRWQTDAALRISGVSAEVRRFGVDAEALLGRALAEVFDLVSDPVHGFPLLAALASRSRFEGQRAVLRGDGRSVRLSGVACVDARGRFAGLRGAADMVDTGIGVPRPAPSPAIARRLERALRGPLARIIFNADNIQAQAEGTLQPGYGGYAADIASAGRHLLGVIGDLADLHAIERDDFVVASEPVDLADIARHAAGLLGVRASAAGVRIDGPAAKEMVPAIGEFRRALQVMVNLVANAVRYSPQGETVSIRLEQRSETACAIVGDAGKGIAPEDQERIFGKFERLEPGEGDGSGLGLYISRRLARAMDGDLLVESAPGQGARFLFFLPLQR